MAIIANCHLSSCALLSTLLSITALAQSSAPKLLNYQGKLTNAGGEPLADGQYQVRFEIFGAKDSSQPGGTTVIWGATYTSIPLVGGQFNVILGAPGGTPVPGAAVNDIDFAFTHPDRYLQMTVESGPGVNAPKTLSPRQQFLSVPYAINGVPTGSVVSYAGASSPPGWLLCDGAVLDGNDPRYAALFNAIAKTYGPGNGSPQSFNLPDFRGRVALGSGAGSGLTSRTIGSVQGAEFATLVPANLPQHRHRVLGATKSDGAHTHTDSARAASDDGGSSDTHIALGDNDDGRSWPSGILTVSGGAHSHAIDFDTQPDATAPQMSSTPIAIMPPSLVVNYIIKL